jgi:hypothetical protein
MTENDGPSNRIARFCGHCLRTLKGIVSSLLFDVWPALRHIAQGLCKLWRRVRRKPTVPEHQAVLSNCIPVRHSAYKRPDPCIYDQYYLASLGLPVSWNNPDMMILRNGVPVTSNDELQPATQYRIRATIQNRSTGVAVDMPVTFSYLSFGMGTQSHFIGSTAVDLGAPGSADCPARAEMDWVTPVAPGHYCVQVSFQCPDDLNPNNNLGQTNTEVVTAQSPVHTSFSVANQDRVSREYHFEVDTYTIPVPLACSEMPRVSTRTNLGVPTFVQQRHTDAAKALPEDWAIALTPERPVIAPGEEVTIQAVITPPDDFHGTQPINIHSWSGSKLVGGITLLVQRD